MVNLRPYQESAIDQSRKLLSSGRKRIVIYAPTGAGKSVIAQALIELALAKGKRVAFLVNRRGLVGQFSKRLNDAGIYHGLLMGDETHGVDERVIVGTVQTAARRGLPLVDMAIIDEAHAVPGSSEFRKLIFAFNNIPWIGLTATPFSKGMGMAFSELQGGDLFQDMVVCTTIKDLVSQGFLVDCDIYAPSEPDLTGVKTKRNQFGEIDYVEQDLGKAVDTPSLIGSIVGHWKQHANGKKTVVFATNIAHSKHIVEQFRAAGVRAQHLDCYMDDEDKACIAEGFVNGDFTVLSNVALLREGWDVPSCECMILARPTKSLIAWVQMVGRVLRPSEGKSRALVFDHSGSVHELGYPTEDLPLELCDGKRKEREPRKAKKERKCPSCHYVKKTHICPQCGFAPEKQNEVEVQDGELGMVKKGKFSSVDKQIFFSELLYYATQKGYQDGWVSNQYREKFGVWPKGMERKGIIPSIETSNWILSRQIAYASMVKKCA